MITVIRHKKTGVFILALLIVTIQAWGRQLSDNIDPTVQAELMQREIQRLRDIEKQGGWGVIGLPKKHYKIGETAPAIRQLKKRLHASGDLSSLDTSSLFTPELERAVKKAQRRFGFAENGIADVDFIRALNVPVTRRLGQLHSNMTRLQMAAPQATGKRIVVNIPEFKLHVYEGTTEVFDMNVVVGKKSSQTATFDDELTHIVFSPYWNVPTSIVQNEILPAMKRNRNYLSNNGYEITGYEGGLPVIRQKPGRRNSLGLVKFLFPNHHAIYFHDTPAKSLFRKRVRAYSHGCIRLEEPSKLAAYLLKDEPAWTPEKIEKAMHAGKEQWVKLSTAVPVYITYYTAWVDHNGELNFRDDIYQQDEVLQTTAARR